MLATLEKTVKCFHPCRLHLIDRRARWLGGCLNNLLNLLRNTLSGYYCDHCSRYIVMNSLHRHGQYREHGSGVIKHFLCCWFVFCPHENANISRLNPNKLQFHNSVLSSSLPKKKQQHHFIYVQPISMSPKEEFKTNVKMKDFYWLICCRDLGSSASTLNYYRVFTVVPLYLVQFLREWKDRVKGEGTSSPRHEVRNSTRVLSFQIAPI